MPSTDGFLHRYFLGNGGKRLHKWLHYFDIYERHFERFRGQKPVMLEIGVMGGGSLQMWKEYFGPGCRIVGLDINPACAEHAGEDVEVFIGDQSNPGVLQSILDKYPRLDIVLDDGSHFSPHMIASFEALYSHVQPRGVYMVEDTHTNYWEDWGEGLKKPGSFMEFVKDKLDEINAAHTRGAVPVSAFTRSTDFIACYDSIVAFEKRPQGARKAPITSGMGEPPDADAS